MDLLKVTGIGMTCLLLNLSPLSGADPKIPLEGKHQTAADFWDAAKKAYAEAEEFDNARRYEEAFYSYTDALNCCRTVQNKDPNWAKDSVDYRIQKSKARIEELRKYIKPRKNVPDVVTAPNSAPVNPAPVSVTFAEPPPAAPSASGIVREVARMEENIAKLRDYNAKLVQEVTDLKSQLMKTSSAADQKAKVLDLESQLEGLKRQSVEATGQSKLLQSMLEKAQKQTAENSVRLDETQAKLKTTEISLSQTQNLLGVSEKKNAESVQKLAENQKQSAETAKLLADVKGKLKAAEDNGTKLAADLANLQAEFKKASETATANALQLKSTYEKQITELNQAKAGLEAKAKTDLEQADGVLNQMKVAATAQLKSTQEKLNAEWSQKLNEANQALTVLTQTHQALAVQADSEKKQVAVLADQAQSLQQQHAEALHKINGTLTEMTAAKTTAEAHAASLSAKIADLDKQLSETQSAVKGADEKNGGQISALEKQLAEVRSKLADQVKSTEKLAAQKSETDAQMQIASEKFESEKSELHKMLETSEKQISALKDQLETVADQSNDGKSALAELSAQNTKLLAEVKSLEGELETAQKSGSDPEQLKKLSGELALSKRAQETIQKTLSASADEIDALNTQIEALQKQVLPPEGMISILKYNELASKFDLATKTLADAAVVNEKMTAQLAELETLRAEVQKLKTGTVAEDYDAQIKRKNEAIDALMKERADLSRRVMDLQTDNERLRGVRP